MKVKNVLIVDDDESIIQLFELIGKRLGLNVISAENGEQGFKAFSYYDFFMAITDLSMPKMNGIDFIEKVRLIPKYRNFPFVILSGNIQEFNRQIAFLENVDIKEKPITKEGVQEIFKSKLLIHDEEAKTINESELSDILVKNIATLCELLLTIITKDKPISKIIETPKTTLNLKGDFFYTSSCVLGGNKTNFVFNFDKTLANALKEGIYPDETIAFTDDELVIKGLEKTITPIIKKTLTNSGFIKDYATLSIPHIMGSLKATSHYLFDFGEIIKEVQLKNKHGSLLSYIVIE